MRVKKMFGTDKETADFLNRQEPTASKYINEAIEEKRLRESIILKGSMSEVLDKITLLKHKYGKDALLTDIIKGEL